MNSSLTIAVPLYNEEAGIKNLHDILKPIIQELQLNRRIETILVNDGSTDNSEKLLYQYFSKVPNVKIMNHEKNLNLGGFLNTIIKNCETEFVVFLDSDCTFDPNYIFDMLKLIDDGTDIINGSPYHPDGRIDGVKKSRLFISYSCNFIYRKITRVDIYTFTSILKMYRMSSIKDIKIQNTGFVSVAELFVKSVQEGSSVKEFPCTLSIRQLGESKINIFNSIVNHIKFITQLLTKKITSLSKYN